MNIDTESNSTDWVPYNEVNWDDLQYTAFHVDTRDFCCSANDFKPTINFVKKKAERNPENWFFTKKQIIELLDRYFKESGGPGEWRMFNLTGEGAKVAGNWELKYIRIYRTKYGFVVYDDKRKSLYSKKVLNSPVNSNKETLNHY